MSESRAMLFFQQGCRMKKTNADGQTFGSWLLAQSGRNGRIGQLIDGAKKDRDFPKYGTPDEARIHLKARKAETNLIVAVDEAERDWLT
jgi:hypothetical protein